MDPNDYGAEGNSSSLGTGNSRPISRKPVPIPIPLSSFAVRDSNSIRLVSVGLNDTTDTTTGTPLPQEPLPPPQANISLSPSTSNLQARRIASSPAPVDKSTGYDFGDGQGHQAQANFRFPNALFAVPEHHDTEDDAEANYSAPHSRNHSRNQSLGSTIGGGGSLPNSPQPQQQAQFENDQQTPKHTRFQGLFGRQPGGRYSRLGSTTGTANSLPGSPFAIQGQTPAGHRRANSETHLLSPTTPPRSGNHSRQSSAGNIANLKYPPPNYGPSAGLGEIQYEYSYPPTPGSRFPRAPGVGVGAPLPPRPDGYSRGGHGGTPGGGDNDYPYSLPFWQKEWIMYLTFFLSVLCALGHHFFYASLDGKEAMDQRKMLRYGSAIAFATKAAMAATGIAAFRQRVWWELRRKTVTIGGVDNLFAATEDLGALLGSWEVWKGMTVACVLGAFVWLTPLLVILTSETLSVEPRSHEFYTECPAVRTLNFTIEETQDWRTGGEKINNNFLLSTSLWNTTGFVEDMWNQTQENFDYYTAPSGQFEQVGSVSLYVGESLTRANAANEICGLGFNCSYELEFVAPGYRCEVLGRGVGGEVRDLNGAKSPINLTDVLPQGNYSWITEAFLGEYESPQWSTDPRLNIQPGGMPDEENGKSIARDADNNWPKRLGAFRTEPVIWVGYAFVKNPEAKAPKDRTSPGWDDYFDPMVMACEHYYTKYNVTFMYNSTIQTAKVTGKEYLRRVVDTAYVGNTTQDEWVNDNTTATPEENYIYPTNLGLYRQTAAYHSIGSLFRRYLQGTIAFDGRVAETKVLTTRLIDRHEYLAIPNLVEEIPKVYEEMVVSMFKDPFFMAVAWAADPAVSTGDLEGKDMMFACQKSRVDNVFRYHSIDLWLVYGMGLLLSVFAVTLGQSAVGGNDGVVKDMRFSSIVAASRGPHLDGLDWSLKDGRVNKSLRKSKVGYGVVTEARPEGLGLWSGPGYGFDRRSSTFIQRKAEFSPGGMPSGRPVPIYGFGVDGAVDQQRGLRSWTFRTPILGQDSWRRDEYRG